MSAAAWRTDDLAHEIRREIAATLGVDARTLTPELSLCDDLAADSLDLVELVVALEERFDVTLPPAVERARTLGDLLSTVRTSLVARALGGGRHDVPTVRARVTAAGDPDLGMLERSVALTPCAVETLTADALYAGPGSTLILTASPDADDATLDWLWGRFIRLDRHGVAIVVRRDGGAPAPPGAR